ncbi:MAG: hypothetical protein FJZ01_09640 [Candidatus Sericytochromatia bacterium]|nr:hypothetical protein [Candidatus Tanganyikabacteria bacterium]
MLLAILHVAFDSAASDERRADWARRGHSLFHVMPTQAPRAAAREFPPDVVAIEIGDRPDEAYPAVRHILGVPRRRGDRWPLVLLEVRDRDREVAAKIAPHATLVPPGASPEDVLAACFAQIARCRQEWECGA